MAACSRSVGRCSQFAGLLAVLTFATGCSDKVRPTPSELPGMGLKLPASTSHFFEHESGGVPFSLFQYRFDFAARDLPGFAKAIPCALGPVETGPPLHATVGTNHCDWYQPDRATKHRSCEGRLRNYDFDVLIDVSKPDPYTAYIVLSD